MACAPVMGGQLLPPLLAETVAPAAWGPSDAADTCPHLLSPSLTGLQDNPGFPPVLTFTFPLKSCTHGHSLGSVFCPLYSWPHLLGDLVHCQGCDWWGAGNHLWLEPRLNPWLSLSMPTAMTGRGKDLGPNEAGSAGCSPSRPSDEKGTWGSPYCPHLTATRLHGSFAVMLSCLLILLICSRHTYGVPLCAQCWACSSTQHR